MVRLNSQAENVSSFLLLTGAMHAELISKHTEAVSDVCDEAEN